MSFSSLLNRSIYSVRDDIPLVVIIVNIYMTLLDHTYYAMWIIYTPTISDGKIPHEIMLTMIQAYLVCMDTFYIGIVTGQFV